LTVAPATERLSKTAAIALLREALLEVAGPDVSLCRAAADRGIFCEGFDRYTDRGLRSSYRWITQRYPGATREELEELADRWQLARQEVNQLPLACDVQTREHDTCAGWDGFTPEELSRFILELTSRNVVVDS
jgi:hypothetical protein